LWIGDDAVRRLLVAKDDYELYRPEGDPRSIDPDVLAHGPLGLFLEACIGRRIANTAVDPGGILHVINIRDWHVPDASYDAERRGYGRHCEAGTWGAAYVDGLAKYLDPAEPLADGRAAFVSKGKVRIYHVHSDSVFDFRPRWEERHGGSRKFHASMLERLLDVLVTGSDEQVAKLATALGEDALAEAQVEGPAARKQSQELTTLVEDVNANATGHAAPLYVAVIGVYTDIKVPVLLAGIRARYEVQNLAVSDTLTASRSLERHLHGLDFADKLLSVEVIHGLGDVCRFLGTDPPLKDESGTVGGENYTQYRSYFADKQNVLAYESEKLQEYARLTERRAIGVYNTIKRANVFLLVFGSLFLCVSLIGSVLNFADPGRWSWQLTLATGGVGLVGLVAAFFNGPMRDLQKNLNNLAAFRMVLEGHSLKTAFTRYHLTTPEVLRELKDEADADRSNQQVKSLEAQLAVIDRFQASDYEALERAVGFTADANGNGANGAAAPSPAPTESAGA
jgi:hypothetical protein